LAAEKQYFTFLGLNFGSIAYFFIGEKLILFTVLHKKFFFSKFAKLSAFSPAYFGV